ncbi:hypothetical protein D3C72_1590330 [compost metagenome]
MDERRGRLSCGRRRHGPQPAPDGRGVRRRDEFAFTRRRRRKAGRGGRQGSIRQDLSRDGHRSDAGGVPVQLRWLSQSGRRHARPLAARLVPGLRAAARVSALAIAADRGYGFAVLQLLRHCLSERAAQCLVPAGFVFQRDRPGGLCAELWREPESLAGPRVDRHADAEHTAG